MNNWINDIKSTSFYFTDKFNQISLSIENYNGSRQMEEEDQILQSNLFLNSAYSSFLKYYFSQKNTFSLKTFIDHPFYSNNEPLYTTWGLDFIGTVDYIW